jgi:predicted ester cyclase
MQTHLQPLSLCNTKITSEVLMKSTRDFVTNFVIELFQNAGSGILNSITPDFIWHGPALMGKCGGRLGELREFVDTLNRAFPKFDLFLEPPILEGLNAVVRWTIRGTHHGDGLAAPTGKLVQFTGIHMLRTVTRPDGSLAVAELWQQWGQMGLLQHLEVIPFIGGPGTDLPGPLLERNSGPNDASSAASTDVASADKEIIRRLFDAVINQGSVVLLDEHISEKIADHNPGPSDLPGRDGIKEVCNLLRKAFPDLHGTIDALIAEGDTVVARWTVRGTNTCKCGGINATQRPMVGTGIDIVRLATSSEGKRVVVDRWGNSDDTGILIQLGLVEVGA